MSDPQQLQQQLNALKVRLFDAEEQNKLSQSIISQIAQKAEYTGQDIDGLLEAIVPIKQKVSKAKKS